MELNGLLLIIFSLAVMGLLAVTVEGLWRHVFAYQITDKDVRVLLFNRLPIYRIPFHKIVKMHEAPFYEVALVPGKHFFTRTFAKRVVIETKNTWFPFTFLTPDNPTAFIADIKKHISH